MTERSRLVYSSDGGRVGKSGGGDDQPGKSGRKRKKRSQAAVQRERLNTPGDGVVRIHRSTKGRKGKGVCLITGVPLEGAELKALAKKLKQVCGTGGALKDGVIEIQGDQRDRLKAELEKRGFTAKLAGG